MNIVDENWKKDNNYRPYCLGCDTMIRMEHTNIGWECGKCGALHDSKAKFQAAIQRTFEDMLDIPTEELMEEIEETLRRR